MSEQNQDGDRLLSPRESQILIAVSEGLPLTSVAEIENVPLDDVRAVCRRALSIMRHPSAALDKATEAELRALAYITEHPSLVSGESS